MRMPLSAAISANRTRTLVAAIGIAALSIAAPAYAKLNRPSQASARFVASGPGGLKIEGKTSELLVTEEGDNVRFVVPLGALDTGIELRNRHMREKYLEVPKYPNAELVVARAALKFPAEGQSSSGEAPGTMTIHGQSKPVTVNYRAQRGGAGIDVSGTIRIDIKQFGIDIPSYLGVTVKPDVDVRLEARVQD